MIRRVRAADGYPATEVRHRLPTMPAPWGAPRP